MRCSNAHPALTAARMTSRAACREHTCTIRQMPDGFGRHHVFCVHASPASPPGRPGAENAPDVVCAGSTQARRLFWGSFDFMAFSALARGVALLRPSTSILASASRAYSSPSRATFPFLSGRKVSDW